MIQPVPGEPASKSLSIEVIVVPIPDAISSTWPPLHVKSGGQFPVILYRLVFVAGFVPVANEYKIFPSGSKSSIPISLFWEVLYDFVKSSFISSSLHALNVYKVKGSVVADGVNVPTEELFTNTSRLALLLQPSFPVSYSFNV